jgi:hypothetical protein
MDASENKTHPCKHGYGICSGDKNLCGFNAWKNKTYYMVRHNSLPECKNPNGCYHDEYIESFPSSHSPKKWFCEIIQDFDGSYYCNLSISGNLIDGIPEYVDYRTLSEGIRKRTGICIPKKKSLIFQQEGRKKYAFIDATQFLETGCVITLTQMKAGHQPDFT